VVSTLALFFPKRSPLSLCFSPCARPE
jgi:hypothetical protein